MHTLLKFLILSLTYGIAIAELNARQLAEFGMMEMLMQNSALTRSNPGRSLECLDYYIPLMQELTNDYDRQLRQCQANEDAARAALDQSRQAELVDMETVSNDACEMLRTCRAATKSMDNFECYANTASDGSKLLYGISKDASSIARELKIEYTKIENRKKQCTSLADRSYTEESTRLNNEMTDCIRGLTAVPTTTTTTTVATTPTQSPTTSTTENQTQTPIKTTTATPTTSTTEAPTDTVTSSSERPTDAPTEAATQSSTEFLTEAATEQTTDSPTEKPTELPTESPTASTTEAPFEPSTNIPSESPIETTSTAPITEASTLPNTEQPSDAPQVSTPSSTYKPQEASTDASNASSNAPNNESSRPADQSSTTEALPSQTTPEPSRRSGFEAFLDALRKLLGRRIQQL